MDDTKDQIKKNMVIKMIDAKKTRGKIKKVRNQKKFQQKFFSFII